MKKLLLALLLLTSTYSISQIQFNSKDYFTVTFATDPGATIKDGFADMLVELEYVGPIYTKVGIEYFPAITPTYLSIYGGIGTSLTNRFNDYRLYGGVRLGMINREDKARVPLFGLEGGFDYNLSEHFFVGLRATYDYRTEGEILGWDKFWRASGFVRVGYKWDYKK